jgi:DNA-binding response OmpR family regulator
MEKKPKLGKRMLKVMLIEDDPTMVSLLTTLLDLEGFMVRAPSNHEMEGILNAIIHEHPHIALVDVNLRAGSGLDLVREIRMEPKIKDMRILMSSGLNLMHECIQAGADGFIMKPFMPDDLINLIHRTVQQ